MKTVENIGVTSRMLLSGAKDPNELVRKVTARKENISDECAEILSVDRSSLVKTNLAKNPNVSMRIAINMLADSTKNIKYALAHNPNCSPQILLELSKDVAYRTLVCQHVNCPDAILDAFINGDDKILRQLAQKHALTKCFIPSNYEHLAG